MVAGSERAHPAQHAVAQDELAPARHQDVETGQVEMTVPASSWFSRSAPARAERALLCRQAHSEEGAGAHFPFRLSI
jgi:hypothetical protein